MKLNYIYLDNAATTPVDPEVLEAMLPYFINQYGNPSSQHGAGRMARLAVETSRKKIASVMGCKPQNIFFTSGGTENANTCIRSSIAGLRVSEIITSRIEHSCVLQTARAVHQRGQATLSYVGLKPGGAVDLVDLDRLLGSSHHKQLVCLMHANNETGAMLDLQMAGEICKRHKAYFFSDTVQTVGHYPMDVSKLTVDFLSASAHKFHGPKGVGFMYVKNGLQLPALITGGAHEMGLRAGTENVASIVGMSKALELAIERHQAEFDHILLLKTTMKRKLLSLGAAVNGSTGEDSLYTVLNVRFPKNEQSVHLLTELDMAGVAVSGGSAYSAGGVSHVMKELGAEDCVNLRFSFSRNNTIHEIQKVCTLLEELCLQPTSS